MSKLLDDGGLMIITFDTYVDEDGLNMTLNVEVYAERNGVAFNSTYNLLDCVCNTAAERNEFMRLMNKYLRDVRGMIQVITHEVLVPLYFEGGDDAGYGLDVRVEAKLSEDGSMLPEYEYNFSVYQVTAEEIAAEGNEDVTRSPEGAQAAADGVNTTNTVPDKCKRCPAYAICHNPNEDAEVLAEMLMRMFPKVGVVRVRRPDEKCGCPSCQSRKE